MAITSNEAVIHADQSQGILLKIPPGMVSIIFRELYTIYITYPILLVHILISTKWNTYLTNNIILHDFYYLFVYFSSRKSKR